MLNKRFKIAKCKTSLKLATSRIKLLKNKKVIQINQMKRELAQLLESGQDRTARIRVEHVIREEKMIAAYDLIEIYCELIVARLPIIESQKTCPIDLKEAITSVIFAAPRCSDIPELVDARKNFTAKYGKEFVSAALELRPDSGVNRMMVEKLSAVAPDLQTKMKVLSAVAKEHNVNWDSTLFEETESKVSDDLLKGPVNFEKASMMNVDTPKIQTLNVQNVHSHEEKLNVLDDFSQPNRRYTLGTQNITSSTDTNPSEMASEMMKRRHSFHNNNSNNSSSGREKNWNMEFKDATSAAQAAAESAERASMAARAAAQLSSQGKISRQHLTQSHESPKASINTWEVQGQYHFKDSYNNSFKDRNPQMDPHKHRTSPKATEGVIGKQASISSSGSHSSTMSEEHDMLTSDQHKVGKRTVNIKTSSYGDAHRDDESETDSDDDDENTKFDTGFEYDEGEARSFFPSPGREESIRPIRNMHISSPKNNIGDKKDLKKVNSRKTRIELNDLVERGSSVYEDEDIRVQSRKSSRKNDIIVEKNSSFSNQADDLDTGKELKFGALTGGLRNNGGLKFPPYTKNRATYSSPSSKNFDDQVSKPNSFNLRAGRLEKKEQSVSMLSSESESDENFVKTGSRFTPPNVSFNDDGITDSEEEAPPVPKLTSARLSHRTKDNGKPKGKTVISSSTETRRSSMHPSTNNSQVETRYYAEKVKKDHDTNPESPTNSQGHIAGSEQETLYKNPRAKIFEPPPSPREKIVGAGIMEARKTSDLSSKSANDVKKPSHVHPKLPEYDSLAARIQSLRANR